MAMSHGLSWTWRLSNGREDNLRQDHDSRAAARRHVKGVAGGHQAGMPRDDVLTLHIRDHRVGALSLRWTFPI